MGSIYVNMEAYKIHFYHQFLQSLIQKADNKLEQPSFNWVRPDPWGGAEATVNPIASRSTTTSTCTEQSSYQEKRPESVPTDLSSTAPRQIQPSIM